MTDAAGALTAGKARRVLAACFAASGLPLEASDRLADALVEADLAGLPSHGLLQAPVYLDRLRAGSISPAAHAQVVSDRGATAVLDAHDMFGHLAGDQAMDLAIAKARQFGVGVVAVRNSFHFGAAGRYVRHAAEAGCIGVATCNTRPLMPAPGGSEPLVGNNPLAIALPASSGADFVLDMALSQAAFGKIRAAATAGHPIPADWAVDADGNGTTDATKAIAGMLLPAGGAKGFGLALALDLMASGLSDGPASQDIGPMYGDPKVPFRCSLLFIALDVAHFLRFDHFCERTGDVLSGVRETRLRDGSMARTPGMRRSAHPHAADLSIPEAVRVALNDRAAMFGVDERF